MHVSSFVFHSVFLCQLHAHTCTCPLYNVLFKVVVVVFREIIVYILLNMTLFVGSQSFISLPSFMLVSAPVSELNQNKKNRRGNWLFPI